ncbi:hypothetical protein BsWGS_00335 [Bradybaena similaris]
MSFMFNFDLTDEDRDVALQSSDVDNKPEVTTVCTHIQDKNDGRSTLCTTSCVQSLPAVEITEFYSDSITVKLEMKSILFGDLCLKVVDTSTIEQNLLSDTDVSSILKLSEQLTSAVHSHSDLVAGVYEGGLKIWESGVDLAEFLASHPVGIAVDLEGKYVLELGCGAGLPGVYCCRRGAKQVDFQDYNEEVLKLLTHTNVVNNQAESNELSTLSRYFAGDWSSFAKLAARENLKYDIILTAETIYNTDDYSKLLDVFKTVLTDSGVIYLAAKTYYFGVGGSIDSFIEYVRGENCFDVEVVHSVNKGVKRKIMKLWRMSGSASRDVGTVS